MEDKVINKYSVTVTVEYCFEVETTSTELAILEGWNYEDYSYTGQVYSIDVELEEEDIYGEEPNEDLE